MERTKSTDYRGGSTEQDNDPMRGASCTGLPYEVQDKYFGASKTRNPWEYRTAVQICGRCVVKRLCLKEAIEMPTPTGGVLAGRGHNALQDLHTEYLKGIPIEELVERTMQLDARTPTRKLRIWHPKPGQGGEARANFVDFPVPYPEPSEVDDFLTDIGGDYPGEYEPPIEESAS